MTALSRTVYGCLSLHSSLSQSDQADIQIQVASHVSIDYCDYMVEQGVQPAPSDLVSFFFFGSHVNPLVTLLWTHSVLFSMASSFTLDRLLARTGVEGQRHAFKSRWRGKGGVKRFEGGWGRRGKREKESGGGG